MMKLKYLIYAAIIPFVFSTVLGQNIEVTHQGNGTTLSLPVQSVDSVLFELNALPPMKTIYQNNGNVLGIAMDDVDSITYSIPNPSALPQVSTTSSNVLSSSSAFVEGNVISEGSSAVVERGICWNTSPYPTIVNNFSSNGTGLGAFNYTVQPLSPTTTYYARAYATNASGTAYGNEIVFNTSPQNTSGGDIPEVVTTPPNYNIDNTGQSAMAGGEVIDDGGLAVTARGVCWAIGNTPTINHNITYDGMGAGNYQSIINNLIPNMSYFVRAYATNDAGTAYGVAYSITVNSVVATLDCAGATVSENPISGLSANGITATISYTGGNGVPHNGQTVTSTGVTGLTATLAPGNYANGSGSLIYDITGTPNTNGIASFAIEIGGQNCTLEVIVDPGSISSLDCLWSSISTSPVEGESLSGITLSIDYIGGNAGLHNGQTVNSTGVTGLTATLAPGSFSNGSGTLIYDITGTPTANGTASFEIDIGGQACISEITVIPAFPCGTSVTFTYKGSSVTYGTVENTATGKCWLDRNLGAIQAANSSTDSDGYGDLFQWGRGDDQHQNRTSTTTTTLSTTDQPWHGEFILTDDPPIDWRTDNNNNRWNASPIENNPCPTGWRVPTIAEWEAERLTWSDDNAIGAFGSPLKLPLAGYRARWVGGAIFDADSKGKYWSISIGGDNYETSRALSFDNNNASTSGSLVRAAGFSVRCIKYYE